MHGRWNDVYLTNTSRLVVWAAIVRCNHNLIIFDADDDQPKISNSTLIFKLVLVQHSYKDTRLFNVHAVVIQKTDRKYYTQRDE
jgi:hypothetical protein